MKIPRRTYHFKTERVTYASFNVPISITNIYFILIPSVQEGWMVPDEAEGQDVLCVQAQNLFYEQWMTAI